MLRAAALVVVLLGIAPLAEADADGDGVEDASDNCVYSANSGQEDSGGLLPPTPDGIGDACQCGDVDDDGLPNVVDVSILRRALLLLEPGLAAPQKCDVAPIAGTCDSDDVLRMRSALAGNLPGLEQVCAAAQPAVCGNGFTESAGGEQCDDGNEIETDGCTTSCLQAPTCDAPRYPGGDRFAVDPATGHCYVSFDDDALTFEGAAGMCVARSGDLVAIGGAVEEAIVHTVQNPLQNPWIGASDAAVEGTFQWLTGQPFDYVNFAPGEPDDDAAIGGNGDCLHLANPDGQWSDTNCSLLGFVLGAICEIENEPPCDDSSYPGGDRFAIDPATGNCYVSFDDDSLAFSSAAGGCTAAGGHLVTITSASEDAIVRSVQNPLQNPWIGAVDDSNDTDSVFDWLTGEPWGHVNFAPGQPDDDVTVGGGGECLHIADSLGRWNDTSCFSGSIIGSICEIESVD